jgi:hypothetical protein
MPSTDRKLELKAKTSVAQTVSQPAVYAKGLSVETCSLKQDNVIYFVVLDVLHKYTDSLIHNQISQKALILCPLSYINVLMQFGRYFLTNFHTRYLRV